MKGSDCPGKVCCGSIPLSGQAPNCTSGDLTSACTPAAQCATSFGTTCTGTEKVRLCSQPSDCTEAGANLCCTFSDDGGSLSFCANTIVAGIAGAKCM